MRKILSFLAVMLSLVWFIYFRPAFLGGPASYIIVSGVSMEPTLYTGDLAVMQRQAAYAPGDIVAFRVPGGHVIHRIVGGSAEEGFITRGDNKTSTDPWRPRPEDIAGRMWFHIPGGGRPLQVLRQPKYILALGGLAAFLFLDDTQKVQTGRKRKGKRMNGKHGTQQSHKGGPAGAILGKQPARRPGAGHLPGGRPGGLRPPAAGRTPRDGRASALRAPGRLRVHPAQRAFAAQPPAGHWTDRAGQRQRIDGAGR